jgi:hypothetical protein
VFEVRVTGHPSFEAFDQTLNAIKMFRMVSHQGLKDCKEIVESMFGIKWDTSLPVERRRLRVERKPYIIPCSTRVRAEQVRIDFNNGGFSTEVRERG